MRLEAREAPSRAWLWFSPVLAAVLSVIGAAIAFRLLGHNVASALHALFVAPLATGDGVAELALKATPLLLCALGIAVAVRANVWNIGAEGQLIAGAIAGGGVALFHPGWMSGFVVPAMLLAGILGGMAWAAVAAFLRTVFNAHEILTTLMLSYVAANVLSWLVHEPWRDPDGFGFPQSRQFATEALLPLIVPGSRLTIAVLFALVAVPLAWALLGATVTGFQIRVAGLAPAAARYAGFSHAGTVWTVLLLSGGLAGLAGVSEAAGPVGQLTASISPGYGFAAIIVAFLGRLHPLGILAASLLMALLYIGGEQLQMTERMPLAVTGTIQGMLLFFLLAADVLVNYRVRLSGRARHA